MVRTIILIRLKGASHGLKVMVSQDTRPLGAAAWPKAAGMKPQLDTVVPALAATVERLEALQHRHRGGPGQRGEARRGQVAVAASLRQRLAEFEDLAPDRARAPLEAAANGKASPSTAELLAHWRKEVSCRALNSEESAAVLGPGG